MDRTLLLAAGLAGCLIPNPLQAAPKRPNVIFIYADDLGKGMLSAYGQRHFTTPHIDSLITQGTSFTRAYGCMLSAPARASLLTGYHDCRPDKWKISGGGRLVGARSEADVARTEATIDSADINLAEGDLYLPEVFRQAGYATAQIGKLEWGFTATRGQMERHGWDYYYGYLDHVRCHGFYPPFLFEDGRMVRIDGNTRPDCGKSRENETPETYRERWDMTGKAQYSQNLFLDKILAFIRGHRDRPFFLFHPTQLPHGPVSVPALHPEVAADTTLTPIEKEYASMVKLLDDQVGAIVAEVRRLGIEQNTIIIFASDNGHEIYYSQAGRCEKPYRNLQTGELFDDFKDKYYSGPAGDVFDGNAGLAGLKRSNLEGGVNIPLAFYWKGHIPAGAASEDMVANYDFLPTVADMLGIRLKTAKDGISYWPVLQGKRNKHADRYVVFGSNYGPAIVTADGWKLRYFRAAGVFELYDLNADPQERHDLINSYSDRAEQLKKLLLEECAGDLDNGLNRAG